MRILFIVHDEISHEPLGIEYLSASLLRAGHETKACMESKALKTIKLWRPDFAAFQVLTGDERRWGAAAKRAKACFPGLRTIFGGPHFLFFSQAQQPEADFVIRGDGEKSIVDVVEGRSHNDFIPLEDLDSRPHLDRGIFYNDDFPGIKNNVIRNVISCRNCPYSCSYCFNSNQNWQKMIAKGKKRLRYHSPDWIIDEIERTFLDYGGRLVSFQDDIFGIDMNWLDEFSMKYQRLKYPFFAQLRPRFITEDRIKLLKKAGLHIVSFAVESGNYKTRKEILDRDEPNELIERGCELLHRYGIKFRMQNLLGLPVDDPLEDALGTLRFNMKMKPTLSWSSCLQAYAGTKIADRIIKMGMVKSVNELNNLTNATFFDECSLPIRDKKKIERLQKYWSACVRWPWLYIIVRILINFDFGRRIHQWVFSAAKTYINKREYWRVDKRERHISIRNKQTMDRLGNEPERVRRVVSEQVVHA